jgi:hypothetical protein
LRRASCKRRCRLIEHGDAPLGIGRVDGGWQSIDDLVKASLAVANLGRSEIRLVGRGSEVAQSAQQAHVFSIKLATVIVIDYPDRAHCLSVHMEREEQPLLDVGLYVREVGEEPLGVGKQQGNIAPNVASQGRGPAKRRPAGCVLRGMPHACSALDMVMVAAAIPRMGEEGRHRPMGYFHKPSDRCPATLV